MELPAVRGVYKINYNLAHLTWFKAGGEADFFFKPADVEDLKDFLVANAKGNKLPVTVIGAGSNIIIRDGGIEGVVVKLGQGFNDIVVNKDGNIEVGAGCLNFNLAKFAEKSSIKDFEFLIGIPGTVGGGIAMNAGSYGSEYKDLVVEVHALDDLGNSYKFTNAEIGFGYRHNNLPSNLIFTKAIMQGQLGDQNLISQKMNKISQEREKTQPVKEKTGGSTFANPEGHKAWQLIDQAGLRGKKIGDAGISQMHCNFMINHGSANARDMEDLGELIRSKVKAETGIDLKWEIKRVGRK
jgi:UDP-N-acetylmuramate dehydrogenase